MSDMSIVLYAYCYHVKSPTKRITIQIIKKNSKNQPGGIKSTANNIRYHLILNILKHTR